MDRTRARAADAGLGQVSVRPVEGEDPLDCWLYSWHPGPEITAEPHEGLVLRLRCRVAADGSRGFSPAEDAEGCLLRASVGGLMFLAKRGGMEPALRGYHHALRLLYQQGRLAAEYHARSFGTLASLLVVGRDGVALGDDVLPARLGHDSRGRGHRWSVGELMGRGREAAVAAGLSGPDEGKMIAYGLYEAAKLDPWPARRSPSKARELVERALFDLPTERRPDRDEKRAVERILDRADDRLEDDAESFHRWFFDGRDNLIRQVAKQVRGGGPIDREIVRRALLRLARAAYQSVGTCVTVQMAAFASRFPQPLDRAERARFEALFIGRPLLGGMPLLMLHERFPFLRPAVLGVMNEPDDPARVGALLTMLSYYGEMAPARREADRAYKRRAGHRNRSGRVAISLPVPEDVDGSSAEPWDVAHRREVADLVRQLGGVSCPSGHDGPWEAGLLGGCDDDPVDVEVSCTTCRYVARFSARREDLRAIGPGDARADGD